MIAAIFLFFSEAVLCLFSLKMDAPFSPMPYPTCLYGVLVHLIAYQLSNIGKPTYSALKPRIHTYIPIPESTLVSSLLLSSYYSVDS
jgi:hypothetical protein